jgi:hypothetical protein
MVSIDPQQIALFARALPQLGTVQPFDFCANGQTDIFPDAGDVGTLDSFFLNAAHQFGFWYEQEGKYAQPMIAPAGGVDRKGSDFLFYCFQRALEQDAMFFQPARLAAMSDKEYDALFLDDNGRNPLPMWPAHARLIRAYAEWFKQAKCTPQDLVDQANAAPRPLAAFLELVGCVPGYAEDPLKKKLMLLAVILENRPEHFLRVTDPESAVPIIDYHLQRSALRTGLVRIEDDALRTRLERREQVDTATEHRIRTTTYTAIEQLVQQSGLSVAAVDYFFFTNRTRCPEMTEPQCAVCPVKEVCARRTSLFQPVYRTEAY